jgi:hypothetical protein
MAEPQDQQEDFDKAVRLKIYELLLASGEMPRVQALADSMSVPLEEIRNALKNLRQKKSLVTMPHSGEILMCQPWCAIPTPHVARVDGRDWFAPCIWDVLAIPAALHKPGHITTSCPCCGERMIAEVNEGNLIASSPAPQASSLVVHIGLPAKQWWDDPFFT